ncbi:MAG: hypothetical protein JOZ73_12010 [Solirubrobacterales bacterium]|nr:hypothetical protein [Solirubrobacterales bacterium]
MSLSVTLNDLRTATLVAANMENSTFIATTPVGSSELDRYINQSWFELYELLLGKGQDLFLSSYSLTLVNGQDTYALPADFYKLRGVDITSGGDTRDVTPFSFAARNDFKNARGWTQFGPVQYRLYGANIVFIPVPGSSDQAKLWYYPAPTAFTSGAQSQDFVAGWDEYVIVDAAIKCLRKEESDVSVLLAQKAALKTRIEENIAVRDAGHPSRVTIVRGGRRAFGY